MRIVLLLALLTAVAPVATAQPPMRRPEFQPEVQRAVVAYQVTTVFGREAAQGSPELPPALLARLADEAALAHLTVNDAGVNVRFVFESVAAFSAWRALASTRTLLEGLDALSPAQLQVAMSMQRRPLADLTP